MNSDRIEGIWKQFSGKKKWSELTDSELTEINGRREKFEGVLQERYVDRWAKNLFEAFQADHGRSS